MKRKWINARRVWLTLGLLNVLLIGGTALSACGEKGDRTTPQTLAVLPA